MKWFVAWTESSGLDAVMKKVLRMITSSTMTIGLSPRGGGYGARRRRHVQSPAMMNQRDISFLGVAVHNLRNHASFRRLERHHAHAFRLTGCLDSCGSWSHKSTKVGEVVVRAGVSDFVGVLIDDHHGMLGVGVGISMNR